MAGFDTDVRGRLAYDRSKFLAGISGAGIIFLVAFIDVMQTYQNSQGLLVMALVGLAFTLFTATGIQIAASAADRWGTETVSPVLLVWEWRVLTAAHLALMLSGILLVSYILANIRVPV